MRLTLGLTIWLLALALTGSGADRTNDVLIRGSAPGYAGQELVFHTWTDQVSFTEKEIFRALVDENERFSAVTVTGENPRRIFFSSGIYYLYMYIEAGREYEILLPEKAEKSAREKLNPYFEGIPTHIAVLNHDSTELNALINVFDRMYEPLFGEPLLRLTADRDRHLMDSIKSVFDKRFAHAAHPWFGDYRRYKIALLEMMAQLRTARNLSDNLFRDEPVLYTNDAYMELFNQVYNRYFLFFSRTARGSGIFDDINKRRSLTDLRITLQTDPVLGQDRLLEMVILKGLHDAFYGSDFSRAGLLAVLDSLASETAYPEHISVSGHIREKVTRLVTGFEPPGFELMNRDGEMKTLQDYKGYYTYINFCTASNYSCLSEYEVLKILDRKHGEYLKIVTIFVEDSYESMMEFLSRNDYDWEFLFYGGQPSVLKEYDIRIFPTYYLTDRNGTLLMSPAPSPAENFENYLLQTMQSRRELR